MPVQILAGGRTTASVPLAQIVDLDELVSRHCVVPVLLARVDPDDVGAIDGLRTLVRNARGSKVVVLASKLDADLVAMLDTARVHGIAAAQDAIEDLVDVVHAINAGEEAVLSPAARRALRR